MESSSITVGSTCKANLHTVTYHPLKPSLDPEAEYRVAYGYGQVRMVKWGIRGTNNINGQFAKRFFDDFQSHPCQARLTAPYEIA